MIRISPSLGTKLDLKTEWNLIHPVSLSPRTQSKTLEVRSQIRFQAILLEYN